MFKKREKPLEIPQATIIEDRSADGLAAKLNKRIHELYESGYEMISVSGYNLEYVQSGPYQQSTRYTVLLVYKKRES